VSARSFFAVAKALFSPVLYLEAVRLMDHASAYAALSSQPNLPAARAAEPAPLECDTLTEWHVRYMSALIMPDYTGTWDRQMSDWTQRALVGVALGVRLYEIDHGQRPELLDELVPDYLPRVPVDLMAADGRKIVYVRNDNNPLVYSVGMNARDEGGKYVQSTRATRRSGKPLPDDIIVYLNGKPAKSAASQPSAVERKEDRNDVQRQPRDP
jgi:hypothetical protein